MTCLLCMTSLYESDRSFGQSAQPFKCGYQTFSVVYELHPVTQRELYFIGEVT